MDEATASKILENYLNGQSSETSFEEALAFLKNSPKLDPGLAALFRDMDFPGGISHETALEIMPYYLEPLARTQLPQDERARFVAHMAQCRPCAAEYLELRGFDAKGRVERQLQTANPKTSPVRPKPWPNLEPVIQPLNDLTKTWRYSISFNLASANSVRETGAKYHSGGNEADDLGEYKVLFEASFEAEGGAYQEAVVTAWRISPTRCDLQVEINDPVGNGRQVGQTVILSFDGNQISKKTNVSGETVFQGLEISKLATLKVEIQLNS